jgi:hypothetical protein
MKRAAFLSVILGLALVPAASAQPVEKRVGRLEKRVGKVEGRVASLEEGAGRTRDGDTRANLKIQPLKVTLAGRKRTIEADRVGLSLNITFENLTNYGLSGFSGKLVFKIEEGGIFIRKISYSHPVAAGETAQIDLVISGSDTKNYLKFVKAKAIKVAFVEQKLF